MPPIQLKSSTGARKAAEAAECAAKQGRFWEMHAKLFADPSALEFEHLSNRARQLNLDQSAFMDCMQRNEAEKLIQADYSEGERLNVTGTPTFFVGVLRGNGSIELARRITGVIQYKSLEKVVAEVAKSSSLKS